MRSHSSSWACGFTVLELLVVISILAVLAIGLPDVTHSADGMRLRGAAHVLVADLRQLRAEAVRQHAKTRLLPTQVGYAMEPGDRARPLPPNVSIRMQSLGQDMTPETHGQMAFFPDGSSTGGSVAIMGAHATMTIWVGWLDGAVTLHEH